MTENKTTTTNLADVLRTNLGIIEAEDGTSRGRFTRLKKSNFKTSETFEAYRLALAYASTMVLRSVVAEDANASAQLRNKAIKHLEDAMAILEAEAGLEKGTFYIHKKHVRAWISSGAFAGVKTNYSSGERILRGKSLAIVQKFLELDCSDILNGRPRLGERHEVNVKTAELISKAEAPEVDKSSVAEASKGKKSESKGKKSEGKGKGKKSEPSPEAEPAQEADAVA